MDAKIVISPTLKDDYKTIENTISILSDVIATANGITPCMDSGFIDSVELDPRMQELITDLREMLKDDVWETIC